MEDQLLAVEEVLVYLVRVVVEEDKCLDLEDTAEVAEAVMEVDTVMMMEEAGVATLVVAVVQATVATDLEEKEMMMAKEEMEEDAEDLVTVDMVMAAMMIKKENTMRTETGYLLVDVTKETMEEVDVVEEQLEGTVMKTEKETMVLTVMMVVKVLVEGEERAMMETLILVSLQVLAQREGEAKEKEREVTKEMMALSMVRK